MVRVGGSGVVLPGRIEAVVFDVGETLVDETRAWSALADAAGITRSTLFAASGALIERGDDHRKVWELLGVERPAEACPIEAGDFYPDARSCLAGLAAAGYRVGLAGNQPFEAEAALTRAGLPVSFVVSSEGWGVEKPSAQFFVKVAAATGVPAERAAYVGDRLDNDVVPAKRSGMFAVFVRRGPWGHLHAHLPALEAADADIGSLDELPPPRGARRGDLWWRCRGACETDA